MTSHHHNQTQKNEKTPITARGYITKGEKHPSGRQRNNRNALFHPMRIFAIFSFSCWFHEYCHSSERRGSLSFLQTRKSLKPHAINGVELGEWWRALPLPEHGWSSTGSTLLHVLLFQNMQTCNKVEQVLLHPNFSNGNARHHVPISSPFIAWGFKDFLIGAKLNEPRLSEEWQ